MSENGLHDKQTWVNIAIRIEFCLSELEDCKSDIDRLMFDKHFDVATNELNKALFKALREIGMIEYYDLRATDKDKQ